MSRRQQHTDLVKACLAWLELYSVFAWQNNTGAVKVGKRFVRFGRRGSADIIGVLPDGQFLAVECKVPPDRLSSTQRVFLAAINEAGGCAVVVTSVDELFEELAGMV